MARAKRWHPQKNYLKVFYGKSCSRYERVKEPRMTPGTTNSQMLLPTQHPTMSGLPGPGQTSGYRRREEGTLPLPGLGCSIEAAEGKHATHSLSTSTPTMPLILQTQSMPENNGIQIVSFPKVILSWYRGGQSMGLGW